MTVVKQLFLNLRNQQIGGPFGQVKKRLFSEPFVLLGKEERLDSIFFNVQLP